MVETGEPVRFAGMFQDRLVEVELLLGRSRP